VEETNTETEKPYSSKQPGKGRNITGLKRGGPGRKKGCRPNETFQKFRERIFSTIEDVYKDQPQMLRKIFAHDPISFLKLAASLMPRDIDIRHTQTAEIAFSDADRQLIRQIEQVIMSNKAIDITPDPENGSTTIEDVMQ
jgi:hypothetical protein